nr:MAG TPA: hypothetical protein [Caudoviricetes sp.]
MSVPAGTDIKTTKKKSLRDEQNVQPCTSRVDKRQACRVYGCYI